MKVTFAAPCLRPPWIKVNRPRGAKAVGLRYERALAKRIPLALHGQWFQYRTPDGPAWCQTDLLLLGRKQAVVIEVKLSDYLGARVQLQNLYLPVLRAAYPHLDPFGIIVLRSLEQVPAETFIFESLAPALRSEEIPLIHWLGSGAI
jgi:hypothetical protein